MAGEQPNRIALRDIEAERTGERIQVDAAAIFFLTVLQRRRIQRVTRLARPAAQGTRGPAIVLSAAFDTNRSADAVGGTPASHNVDDTTHRIGAVYG